MWDLIGHFKILSTIYIFLWIGFRQVWNLTNQIADDTTTNQWYSFQRDFCGWSLWMHPYQYTYGVWQSKTTYNRTILVSRYLCKINVGEPTATRASHGPHADNGQQRQTTYGSLYYHSQMPDWRIRYILLGFEWHGSRLHAEPTVSILSTTVSPG